jgi:hypothetical protein
VYLIGGFTTVGDSARRNVAAVDGTTGAGPRDLKVAGECSRRVSGRRTWEATTAIGDSARMNVAAVDAATSLAAGGIPPPTARSTRSW